MPPSALITIVNRANKIPAQTGTLKEERLLESEEGRWLGLIRKIQQSPGFRNCFGWLYERTRLAVRDSSTQLMHHIATCAANIMPFVPRQHPKDLLQSGAQLGCWDRFPILWILYCGLGSNLYCNIVGGCEHKLILTQGSPEPVGNKLVLG